MSKDVTIDIPFRVNTQKSSDGVLIIEGYANKVLDDNGELIVDRDGDAILGWKLDDYLKNPILLYQHRTDQPVGKTVEVLTTPKGLYIKGEIYEDINKEVFAAVKNGVIKTFSVGFRNIKSHYDPDTDIYYYLEVDLHEISLVSVPANQDSIFEVVETPCGNGFCLANKSYSKSHNIQDGDNEKSLKGGEMTKDELEAMLNEFKQDMLDTIQKSLGVSVDSTEDNEKESEENIEKSDNDNTSEESQDIPLKTAIDSLSITSENLEEVIELASKLNEEINTTVEQLLD